LGVSLSEGEQPTSECAKPTSGLAGIEATLPGVHSILGLSMTGDGLPSKGC
jgi:hypothetical protein